MVPAIMRKEWLLPKSSRVHNLAGPVFFQESGLSALHTNFQEKYNTPLEHTQGNPPSQLWKESLYSLLVKV